MRSTQTITTVRRDVGYFPNQHFSREWRCGDEAWLHWNGFPQVPRYMDGWSVTVLGPSSGRSAARIYRADARVPLYRVQITEPGGHSYWNQRERVVRADQLERPHSKGDPQ